MDTTVVLWRICAFALCGLACGLIGYAMAARRAAKQGRKENTRPPSGAANASAQATVQVPRPETIARKAERGSAPSEACRPEERATRSASDTTEAALTTSRAMQQPVTGTPATVLAFASPDAITETIDMSELLPALPPPPRADPEDARTTVFDASRFAKRAELPPVPTNSVDRTLAVHRT